MHGFRHHVESVIGHPMQTDTLVIASLHRPMHPERVQTTPESDIRLTNFCLAFWHILRQEWVAFHAQHKVT